MGLKLLSKAIIAFVNTKSIPLGTIEKTLFKIASKKDKIQERCKIYMKKILNTSERHESKPEQMKSCSWIDNFELSVMFNLIY